VKFKFLAVFVLRMHKKCNCKGVIKDTFCKSAADTNICPYYTFKITSKPCITVISTTVIGLVKITE
jgi:hypothetical protein